MDNISFEDVVSIYKDCLLYRKGRPFVIKDVDRVNDQIKVRLFSLLTQRYINVPFKLEEYSAPPNRIGFVNVEGGVLYLARCPRRLYKAGWHHTNTEVRGVRSGVIRSEISDGDHVKVCAFTHPGIAEALFGNYPSLKGALGMLNKAQPFVAFDKQFAISMKMEVFYKTEIVGHVKDGVIKFNPGKEYLSALLENNYEKASRNFAPSPL